MADQHRPRKRFGQHFLHDPGVIARIAAAIDPRPLERVVEIGPGLGALTEALLARCEQLDVVEIDRDLAQELLRSAAAVAGRMRVHAADALRFDFAGLTGSGERLRVVGNLPYNISTPLMFRLLEQAGVIRDMHFMLQKEVVDRLAARAGDRAYGRLSVMIQLRCTVQKLFDVGPGAFHPPPRVDSAVVRLVPRGTPAVEMLDPEIFAKTVARAFTQRRKSVRAILKDVLSAEELLALNVAPLARPETLDLAAFARIANAIAARQGGRQQAGGSSKGRET